MKLELDSDVGLYQIRAYSTEAIVVNDRVLHHSCIIMPDRLLTDWPPQRMAELTADHMTLVADLAPEVVILGSGQTTRFPPPAVLAPLSLRAIGCEVMDTAAACRSYVVLAAEGRRVAAALLPPNAD
ncbi:MAG: Mth938-like domain-containing protein [Chromatiales bacterium]